MGLLERIERFGDQTDVEFTARSSRQPPVRPCGRDQSVGVERGWTSGFAETLRDRFREFSDIEIHSFGHYLEIFSLTVEQRETGKVSHSGNVTGSGLPPSPIRFDHLLGVLPLGLG